MGAFVVDPGELSGSYGGKPAAKKPETTPVASTKMSNDDIVGELEKERQKQMASLKADQAKVATTPDPDYRIELQDRIARTQKDLESINREIVHVGGTSPTPSDAPASSEDNQGSGNHFVVDAGEIKNSFQNTGNANNAPAFKMGANNFRTFGATDSDVAKMLAEMYYRAPTGSVSELQSRLAPKNNSSSVADVARAMAEEKAPQITAPVAPAVEPAPSQSSGEKWGTNWAGDSDFEGFEGGVPEAAQKFNRGKPQGKVSSDLYKRGLYKPNTIVGSGNYYPGEVSAAVLAAKNAADDAALDRTRKALYESESYKKALAQHQTDTANRAAQIAQEEQQTLGANRLSGPLDYFNKLLHGAGVAAGAYDTVNRAGWLNKAGDNSGVDRTGALISGLGTIAQAAAPVAEKVIGRVALGGLGATALPAVAGAAPLLNMARDRIKFLQEHPEAYEGNPTVNGITYDPSGFPYRQ